MYTPDWATYYGGTNYDLPTAIRYHNNRLFIVGTTFSDNFPASHTFKNPRLNYSDQFLVAFEPNTGRRIWAEIDGGQDDNFAYDMDRIGTEIFLGGSYFTTAIMPSGIHSLINESTVITKYTDVPDFQVNLTSNVPAFTCNGNFTGATLTANIPYGPGGTYNYTLNSNPPITTNAPSLPFTITQPGKYTVKVTNQSGSLIASDAFELTLATSPIIAINKKHLPCLTEVSVLVTNYQVGHTYEVCIRNGRALLGCFNITNANAYNISALVPATLNDGTYTVIVTDKQSCLSCEARASFTITPFQALGTPGILTTIDASRSGGTVDFSGDYHVLGPLAFESGNFKLAPGTKFYFEPYNGVSYTSAGVYDFEYDNGCSGLQTFLVLRKGAHLFLDKATLTLADCGASCTSGVRWGGINLVDNSSITSTAESEISFAQTGIGLATVSQGALLTNSNNYFLDGITIKNCRRGFWDKNNFNPLASGEGIKKSNFQENYFGITLEGSNTQGSNYGGGVFTENNFINNNTGITTGVNNLMFEANIFTKNNTSIIISTAFTTGLPATAKLNNISVPLGKVGIGAGGGSVLLTNTITGTYRGAGSGEVGIEANGTIIRDNNTIQGLERGIYLRETTGTATIEENTIRNNTDGVYVLSSYYDQFNLIIRKNWFDENNTGINFAHYNNRPTSPIVECNTFSANTPNFRGIYLASNTTLDNTGFNNGTNNSTLGGPGDPLDRSIRRPNGNKFTGGINPIVNLAPATLNYYIYNGSSDDLKPYSQVLQPAQGILGQVNLITGDPRVVAANACGGGTNPVGVNLRTAGSGSTGSVNSNATAGQSSKTEKASLGLAYPNPARDETFVPYRLPGGSLTAELQVLNITTGKRLQTYYLMPERPEGEQAIDLRTLPNGVYIYRLIIDGRPVESKLLSVSGK